MTLTKEAFKKRINDWIDDNVEDYEDLTVELKCVKGNYTDTDIVELKLDSKVIFDDT